MAEYLGISTEVGAEDRRAEKAEDEDVEMYRSAGGERESELRAEKAEDEDAEVGRYAADTGSKRSWLRAEKTEGDDIAAGGDSASAQAEGVWVDDWGESVWDQSDVAGEPGPQSSDFGEAKLDPSLLI